MAYSVSDLAELSGVTARTLHHYDAIGLLAPRGRTDAGYRICSGSARRCDEHWRTSTYAKQDWLTLGGESEAIEEEFASCLRDGEARFAAHYDDRAAGLAAFVHDAILANALDRMP